MLTSIIWCRLLSADADQEFARFNSLRIKNDVFAFLDL